MADTLIPHSFELRTQNSTQFTSRNLNSYNSNQLGYKAIDELFNNFSDGILVLTQAGNRLWANESARYICSRLSPCSAKDKQLPKSVEKVCQIVIDNNLNHNRYHQTGAELEIQNQFFTSLRIRVMPLKGQEGYLLVILEDKGRSVQRLALTEANLYQLTQRETEVWRLYRTKQSRKDMADTLFITTATVKKHIKNILRKQRAFHAQWSVSAKIM